MIAIILSIMGVALMGLIVVGINSPGRLTALKDADGKRIKGSIAEKLFIEINGIKQGIFIRGENPQNPVILYLHGGPGTPMLQFISYLEKEPLLEKYFTICYWDQRGSGMTYTKSTGRLTVEEMIEDTRQVTEYLKSCFGQDKIYLLGHSWGTYLSVKTIEKYPENYIAYIGIGQVTDQTKSERLAYEYMLKHAKETDDSEVIEKLSKYDPYADDFPQLDYLLKVRTEIINKYRIGHLHRGLDFKDIVKAMFLFKGYTAREKINWFIGADLSMQHLFPVILNDDLFKSSSSFEIPFYVIQGIYDYQVSTALAKEYLDTISAPKKDFFIFENSAHSPNMEEPEKFVEVIRKIAKENPMN